MNKRMHDTTRNGKFLFYIFITNNTKKEKKCFNDVKQTARFYDDYKTIKYD